MSKFCWCADAALESIASIVLYNFGNAHQNRLSCDAKCSGRIDYVHGEGFFGEKNSIC